jgi:hypothetical protein
MKKFANLDELILLLNKYKSITLDEIESHWNDLEKTDKNIEVYGEDVANRITGFANPLDCAVCSVVNNKCIDCVWLKLFNEFCYSNDTYKDIEHACTPLELYKAINARAKYIEDLLNGVVNILNNSKNTCDLNNKITNDIILDVIINYIKEHAHFDDNNDLLNDMKQPTKIRILLKWLKNKNVDLKEFNKINLKNF